MSPVIPDTALDTHIGVLGRTGSGKTYTARGLAERLLDAQRQVVIVDPTGAWWGLRSAYPIPIFGGKHGDVEITDQSGSAVAETILSHHTSAIIDLSSLARQSGAAMRRFMTAFIARLKDRERGALWLVIDEADEFLPQVLSPDMTHLFGELKWIVRRGRVAGWRVMMITQRPQDIAKSVLTQIGTLVAHRLTAPQDRKAVEEWVKGHADPDEAKAVLSSLAGLGQGEAWVWSPDHGLLARSAMPPIRSFDSGATPDADSGTVEQPALAAIDMTAIRATLEGSGEVKVRNQNATDATDGNRLSYLEHRVADLETERDALRDACERKDLHIRQVESALTIHQGAFKEYAATIAAIEVGDGGSEAVEDRPASTNTAGDRYALQGRKARLQSTSQSCEHRPESTLRDALPAPTPARQPRESSADAIPPRWQRVLDGIAWASELLAQPAVERNVVAWLADISPKSSSYSNDLGAMRTRGLIEYPGQGTLKLTPVGEERAQWPTTPPSKEALLEAISSRLEPRHRRILYALWNTRPEHLQRTDLADRAQMSASSSSFSNDLGKLRTLGLIDYPGAGLVSLGRVLS